MSTENAIIKVKEELHKKLQPLINSIINQSATTLFNIFVSRNNPPNLQGAFNMPQFQQDRANTIQEIANLIRPGLTHILETILFRDQSYQPVMNHIATLKTYQSVYKYANDIAYTRNVTKYLTDGLYAHLLNRFATPQSQTVRQLYDHYEAGIRNIIDSSATMKAIKSLAEKQKKIKKKREDDELAEATRDFFQPPTQRQRTDEAEAKENDTDKGESKDQEEGSGRKLNSPSNWILFVKKFAQNHGLSYSSALKNPQVSMQYKKWKKSNYK